MPQLLPGDAPAAASPAAKPRWPSANTKSRTLVPCEVSAPADPTHHAVPVNFASLCRSVASSPRSPAPRQLPSEQGGSV